MNGKIKVAFIKFMPQHKKTYMFEMPTDEYLDEGNTVIVPNSGDDPIEAKVVDTQTFDFRYESHEEEFNRLIAVAGADLPLKKVIGKVRRTYYKYGEEMEDE